MEIPSYNFFSAWSFLDGNLNKRTAKVENLHPVKKKKSDHDKHVCLKCGIVLARGRESYKRRHWDQKHNDEKLDMSLIVPADHQDAIQLLTVKTKEHSHTVGQTLDID